MLANLKFIPMQILFFLMMFAPLNYQGAKTYCLIIVIIVISMKILIEKKITISKDIVILSFFYTIIGLFFVLLGVVRGSVVGAVAVSTVYVVYPILFTYLISGISKEIVLVTLIRTLIFSTLIIGVYGTYWHLTLFGILNDSAFIFPELIHGIDMNSGYIKNSLISLSSLFFSIPFIICALIIWPPKWNIICSRVVLWITLFFNMLVIVFSGRTIMWILLIFSMVCVICINIMLKKTTVSNLLPSKYLRNVNNFLGAAMITGLAIYIIVAIFMEIDLEWVYSILLETFNLESGESTNVRIDQFWAILDDWMRYPLFGIGHGGTGSYIRSLDSPWMYELSYLGLLLHTGLVGFIAYAYGVYWILSRGFFILQSNYNMGLYMFPAIVGLLSFLLANATNSYLENFDYMWVLFLPISIINLCLQKT